MTSTMLGDAVLLFNQFVQGTWSELHVRSGGLEFYARRGDHGTNPMRRAGTPPAAIVAATFHDIAAPHLATFRPVIAAGSQVTAGQPIAWLELMDERHPLNSDRDGVIETVHGADGVLVEYGQTLITIREVA